MKKYILALFTLITLTPSYAIDPSTISALNKQGFEVIMGELTGAGSKVSMQRLAGFVLTDGIILKEKCTTIIVKDSINKDAASIIRVVFENQNIEAQEFEGIIVKK
jgi:hypothetical protein